MLGVLGGFTAENAEGDEGGSGQLERCGVAPGGEGDDCDSRCQSDGGVSLLWLFVLFYHGTCHVTSVIDASSTERPEDH